MIDIKGLDKAEVLKALYDNSHVQGMGFLQVVPAGTVTVDHCRELLKQSTYFDYLYGRVLKVDLSGDKFDERLYERDNGFGSAGRAMIPLWDRLEKKAAPLSILAAKRQEGKTTHLIKMSADGKGTIIAPTMQNAKYIKTMAKEMKLDIPDPICWSDFLYHGRGLKGPFLLDELGSILAILNIKVATVDVECIKELSGGQ